MSVNNKFKLDKYCRGCMQELSNINPAVNANNEIRDMFTYCTNIMILSQDRLPKEFCSKCSFKIDLSYNFIKECKNVDTKLQNMVSSLNMNVFETDFSIKQENLDRVTKDGDASSDLVANDLKDDSKTSSIHVERDYCSDIENHNSKSDTPTNECTNNIVKKRKCRKKRKLLNKTDKDKIKKQNTSKFCPVCRTEFMYKKDITVHLTTQHPNYNEFVCHHCDKGFSQRKQLRRHMAAHREERPFACDICGNTYKLKPHLTAHAATHSDDKPYQCKDCGMGFKRKNVLAIHTRLHMKGKLLLCHVCGKGFTQVGNLIVHMRSHTGEQPYVCSSCEFRCSTVSSLRRHTRTHRGLKPYPCEQCGKAFSDSWTLARHKRIHSGELPYKCWYCPKAFIASCRRKKHTLQVHNMAPPSGKPNTPRNVKTEE